MSGIDNGKSINQSEAVDARLPVLYVAGYGRSGSTILDILLGQHERLLGAGELGNLSKRVWPRDEYCACGERVRACPFWPQVVQRWSAQAEVPSLAEYHQLQLRFEGMSSALAAAAGLPALPGFDAYRRGTVALLRALRAVSGKQVVVDSSKLPGRLMALARMPEIDLRVIHLVRDGRGVAWSLMKAHPKDERAGLERPLKSHPVARTALRWALTNLTTEQVCRRIGDRRWLQVRYEDLLADPQSVLARIGDMLALDVTDLRQRMAAGQPITPGHQVAGNRLRMGAGIQLRMDGEWLARMPERQRRSFQRLCGHLQRRYGYV